ncbi:MotA/TolQ/ExbB proton channel [Caldalkalibacillus thermarum TA2.A1]|uniref:MotA/TolQ/ExbB proton channel n=1 Tax=Caldalkalibacillus thermarum (strain TA2.A1) TaxID=986075 RepID=F5L429_CALTT|nr:MotA/TolQ/ExbB proton channel family protein [Caldalkalibacillus thermarum]EGL83910.1 MotA/TolQ/ExbB proton channel [Caldalkalibacillus thermarum TA2.A1]QZT33852.1 MotA/TolQ/ExbB proton channel family protein [Caldalkalibacillus thermarum TA2.A1]
MRQQDWLTPLGILLGFGIIILAIYFAGGIEGLSGFVSLSSFVTVVGGLTASLFVGFGGQEVKNMFSVLHKTFRKKNVDFQELMDFWVLLARKARQKGVVTGLEQELEQVKDPFVRKGLGLVIDGHDPQIIRQILAMDIAALQKRHARGHQLISKAAELSPGWGMVGTIVGLVLMLQQIENPQAIGPAIALALITTLYGVLLANLVFNPIANKLMLLTEEEVFIKEIIVEALISIRNDEGPVVLREKLQMFLTSDMYGRLKPLDQGGNVSL